MKWIGEWSAVLIVGVAFMFFYIFMFHLFVQDQHIEAPLSSIYYNINRKKLDIEYFGEEGVSYAHVSIDKIEVALRTDGESYSSVRLVYEDRFSMAWSEPKRAVILVPLAEDVQAWQVRLEEIRNQIEEATRPRHVLPRGNQP